MTKTMEQEVANDMMAQAEVGNYIAKRLNRIDKASRSADQEELTRNVLMVKAYLAALLHTNFIDPKQEEDLLSLVEMAKDPYTLYGKTYWDQHVGWRLK